jgi:heme/copper-type cytochrome/quinol oxidase subunit 3
MAHVLPRQRPLERPTPRLTVVRRGGGGPPPTYVWRPPISNAQLGIVIFIAFETMMFAGLLAAYGVLRATAFAWPPPDLPRLPLAVTWVNTLMLSFSAFTMRRATVAIRAGREEGMRSALMATAVLGVGFLAVQGSEWVRLIHQGLTLASGSFGAIFYSIIGLHAIHVAGAVGWLLGVLVLARRGRVSAQRHVAVNLCATYWGFVCALWLVLFGVVYLS